MLILEVLFVTIVFQNVITIQCYSYCQQQEKELCNERRHIACHPDQISSLSEFKKLFPITSRLRSWIIYLHNQSRNEVACGKIKGSDGKKLPTAARMRELVWDYELAYLARLHAQRCRMKHDACRTTQRIKQSGQNLAVYETINEPPKAMDLIDRFLTKWSKEGKAIDKTTLRGENSGGFPFTRDITGHFTLLVHEKITRVGCAMSLCLQNITTFTHFTCNYDYNNVLGEQVYNFGNAASDCPFWHASKSSNFSCLCGNTFWSRKYLSYLKINLKTKYNSVLSSSQESEPRNQKASNLTGTG